MTSSSSVGEAVARSTCPRPRKIFPIPTTGPVSIQRGVLDFSKNNLETCRELHVHRRIACSVAITSIAVVGSGSRSARAIRRSWRHERWPGETTPSTVHDPVLTFVSLYGMPRGAKTNDPGVARIVCSPRRISDSTSRTYSASSSSWCVWSAVPPCGCEVSDKTVNAPLVCLPETRHMRAHTYFDECSARHA
jgi:hypothetical protein